jgi:hypothetical protein
MGSALFTSRMSCFAAAIPPTSARRVWQLGVLGAMNSQALPTDAIGTFALTLTNLVVGSAIQVEDQAGTTTFFNGTAGATSQLINVQAYAPGSALNNLRIKVRKGSASPYYLPFQTLAVAFVGAQSIYVSQIPDE